MTPIQYCHSRPPRPSLAQYLTTTTLEYKIQFYSPSDEFFFFFFSRSPFLCPSSTQTSMPPPTPSESISACHARIKKKQAARQAQRDHFPENQELVKARKRLAPACVYQKPKTSVKVPLSRQMQSKKLSFLVNLLVNE